MTKNKSIWYKPAAQSTITFTEHELNQNRNFISYQNQSNHLLWAMSSIQRGLKYILTEMLKIWFYTRVFWLILSDKNFPWLTEYILGEFIMINAYNIRYLLPKLL